MLRQPSSIVTLAALLSLGTVSDVVLQARQAAFAQSPPVAAPVSVPAGTKVRIDGSTTMAGLSQTLKEKFESQFSGTQVELAQNGTDAALKALQEGKIDLAAIGRPLTDAEKAAGLVQTPITRRKIAVVVGDQNPFPGDMTGEQFAGIFRGQIVNWAEIGGPSRSIRMLDRVNTDTRLALQPYPVFQGAPFQTGSTGVPINEEATDAMIRQLGNDGISYALVDQVANQPGVKIVSLYGTLPTDPSYPFSQPLSYVYKGPNPSPAVQAFLATAGAAVQAPAAPVAPAAPAAPAAPSPGAVAPVAPIAPGVAVSPAPNPGAASPGAASPGAASPGANPGASPAPAAGGASPNANPNAAASPADPNAVAQAPALDATGRGGVPGWLWLLSIPLLGGLIFALLKGLGSSEDEAVDAPVAAASAGAVSTAALAADRAGDNSRIILTPRGPDSAYAYWEVPESHKQRIRKDEGGQKLALRLYDVTGLEFDRHPAHSIQEFECDELDQDLHIPIPQTDRDYLVELGYVTYQGRWVKLAQSDPVHIGADGTPSAPPTAAATPSPTLPVLPGLPSFGTRGPDLNESLRTGGVSLIDPNSGSSPSSSSSSSPSAFADPSLDQPPAPDLSPASDPAPPSTSRFPTSFADIPGVAGAAAAGGAALGAISGAFGGNRAETADSPPAEPPARKVKRSQIVLTPRNSQEAYAYWEVLEHHKEIAKQHGGQNFILRICDVTGIDVEQQAPHSIQQFNCEETDQDRHVTVPDIGEYVAEIGYLAKNGRWLRIARSAPVRIPPLEGPDLY